VRREEKHLENLRLMISLQGLPQAVTEQNAETLRGLLTPVILNNRVEIVVVADLAGREILTLGLLPGAEQYVESQGADFSGYPFVQNTLQGQVDAQGDKYVGLIDTSHGLALFTSAPVVDPGGQQVGAMLVGSYIETILGEAKSQALADAVFIGLEQNVLATTLVESTQDTAALTIVAQQATDQNTGETFDLNLYGGRAYQLVFTPLAPRQQRLGWLGVILPSNFVVATEAVSRNTFSIVFTLGTLAMIIIGYLLSQSIARPILRLRRMSQAVAAGDLNQTIGLRQNDEIGDLAQAFDQMTLHLRERTEEAERLYAETVQRNIELAEINARLQATQLQLVQSEKLAAVGQLTAGIVHDVKNPLTVIKGMTELIQESEEVSPKTQDKLKLIRESADKASRIVSDLLKFARQSQLEMKRQDLREPIDAALRLTAYLIRKAEIQLETELPDQPMMALFDAQQIEQVLINMIHNAIQAMPERGVLTVCLDQQDGSAAIGIRDTGVGIAPENLRRIFDPFFTTKPAGEGTGLGLSVSYGIIASHHGRIEVESDPGKGTTFTILLPTETTSQPAGEPSA
jgi:signal transduction histidine kinase